ncbi:MAG: Inner membrane ABC transporter permease protein YcjP [Syntrophomonadaceae bacterium]|nr:Inner membrane ABC transporter permease protein YcjP [Bacillota bacterium]MBT9147593.1 Inner membrane ABC transporter permease protein YcjP [Bacillota bacterium]
MIPLATPGLVATLIYIFISAWTEFIFALTFTITPEQRPLTVGLYHFIGRWSVQWQHISAAAIMAVVPIVLLFMVIEKQLVKSLVGGAVKD